MRRKPLFLAAYVAVALQAIMLLTIAFPVSAAREEKAVPSQIETIDSSSMKDAATAAEEAEKIEIVRGVPEDETRMLRIGETEIAVPLLKGYRDIEMLDDVYRTLFERVLPAEARLLDLQMHEDEESTSLHEPSPHVHYELFTMKGFDTEQFTDADWKAIREAMPTALEKADFDQIAKKNERRLNKAMEDFEVDDFRVESRETAKPKLYRNDERTIRFMTNTASMQTIEDKQYEVEEIRVVAIIYVRKRVLYVVASKEYDAGKSAPREVIDKLDAYVDRVLKINP